MSEWEKYGMALTRQDINRLAPLVKDKEAWDAFLFLIEHEESKLFWLLNRASPDELVRISGKFELLQQLKKLRDQILNATS